MQAQYKARVDLIPSLHVCRSTGYRHAETKRHFPYCACHAKVMYITLVQHMCQSSMIRLSELVLRERKDL